MSGFPGDDVDWSFLELTLYGSEENEQRLSCMLLGGGHEIKERQTKYLECSMGVVGRGRDLEWQGKL